MLNPVAKWRHLVVALTVIATPVLVAVGLVGGGRYPERFDAKQVVVPVAFWYFSIAGGLVLTVYAIHRNDPVFIFGQGLGLIIYFRNLHLHYKGKGRAAAS